METPKNRGTDRHTAHPHRRRYTRSASPDKKQRHKCDICGRCFTRKDNLNSHQRVHNGEMPYECKYCGSPFRWLGALQIHERNHARDGHEIGRTMPSFRKRQAVDMYMRKPLTDHGKKETRGQPRQRDARIMSKDGGLSRRSEMRGEVKGRRETREKGGTSRSWEWRGPGNMVVVTSEDPGVEHFVQGPWHCPLDHE